MTAPTDLQIEELAKAMRRAGGMEDDWEKMLFPQNIRAVWARYARAAWDHVARQIMPVQVGDVVEYNGPLAYHGLRSTIRSVYLQNGHRPLYGVEGLTGGVRIDTLTLIPTGESGNGEESHG